MAINREPLQISKYRLCVGAAMTKVAFLVKLFKRWLRIALRTTVSEISGLQSRDPLEQRQLERTTGSVGRGIGNPLPKMEPVVVPLDLTSHSTKGNSSGRRASVVEGLEFLLKTTISHRGPGVVGQPLLVFGTAA